MDAVTQGTLVAERYRLIRQVGLGGMGMVWLAYDEGLASHCAVKLLLPEPGRNEELQIRFECEAKCAAQLRSPHVVDVFDRGQWQGNSFIVMEYLEGEDLAARLERVGRLDLSTTYRIVAQVARALTRAHSVGIIHRDIKPANIFLTLGDEHEIAKVLDFGIAKHGAMPNAFENTQGASFAGTPSYMSPEQVRGEIADYRSDLWALAIITFECLTVSLPFREDSVGGVLRAIASGNLPALTAGHSELPSTLEAWWRRATAANVDHRFQSAKDLADALGEALGLFSKLPISHPSAHADTLLAVPDAAAASPRGIVSHISPLHISPLDAVDGDAPSTLRAHERTFSRRNASTRSSLRIPMHSRRALTLAGAAACAVMGFAVSSFSAELGLNQLSRHWQRVSALIEEPSRVARPVTVAAQSAVLSPQWANASVGVSAASPPKSAEAEPIISVVPLMASKPGSQPERRSQPVQIRPIPKSVKPARSSKSSPTPNLPGELLDPSTKSNSASEAPDPDEELPRAMPPGEKDYGI